VRNADALRHQSATRSAYVVHVLRKKQQNKGENSMKKQKPNKLSLKQIESLCDRYVNNNLNITQEAKRLGVARRSIYFHLWKWGIIKKKKKSLWQRIKEYFTMPIYSVEVK
jgi:transcriptional regulator of acetoin/glycerol metabolism